MHASVLSRLPTDSWRYRTEARGQKKKKKKKVRMRRRVMKKTTKMKKTEEDSFQIDNFQSWERSRYILTAVMYVRGVDQVGPDAAHVGEVEIAQPQI